MTMGLTALYVKVGIGDHAMPIANFCGSLVVTTTFITTNRNVRSTWFFNKKTTSEIVYEILSASVQSAVKKTF